MSHDRISASKDSGVVSGDLREHLDALKEKKAELPASLPRQLHQYLKLLEFPEHEY